MRKTLSTSDVKPSRCTFACRPTTVLWNWSRLLRPPLRERQAEHSQEIGLHLHVQGDPRPSRKTHRNLQWQRGEFYGRRKGAPWSGASLGPWLHRECHRLRDIRWRFSPPSAPHFGGVWERLVQSTKRTLYVILGDQTTTDEILITVVAEVEAILNGRPLTHVSVDPQEPEALTPNHFLLGRSSPEIPPVLYAVRTTLLR